MQINRRPKSIYRAPSASWIMEEYVHLPRRKRAARAAQRNGRTFNYNRDRENARRRRQMGLDSTTVAIPQAQRVAIEEVLLHACPRCGADVGIECSTSSGRVLKTAHAGRYRETAYRLGGYRRADGEEF